MVSTIHNLFIKASGVALLLGAATFLIYTRNEDAWVQFVLLFTLTNIASQAHRFGVDTKVFLYISKDTGLLMNLRKSAFMYLFRATPIIIVLSLVVFFLYKDKGLIYILMFSFGSLIISYFSVILESIRATGEIKAFLALQNILPYTLLFISSLLLPYFQLNYIDLFLAYLLPMLLYVVYSSLNRNFLVASGDAIKGEFLYLLVVLIPFLLDWGWIIVVESSFSDDLAASFSFEMRVASTVKMMVAVFIAKFQRDLLIVSSSEKWALFLKQLRVILLSSLLLVITVTVVYYIYNLLFMKADFKINHVMLIFCTQSFNALFLYFISLSVIFGKKQIVRNKLLIGGLLAVNLLFFFLLYSINMTYQGFLYMLTLISVLNCAYIFMVILHFIKRES